MEPRESGANGSQPSTEIWSFNNRTAFNNFQTSNNVTTTSTTQNLHNNVQHNNQTQHLNNNNNNNNSSNNIAITSNDICGLNVDFLYSDKISTSTSSQENSDYASYVDEFLKNAFPTAFESTLASPENDSIDMMNIEQQQPFTESVDFFGRNGSSTTTPTPSSATFYSSNVMSTAANVVGGTSLSSSTYHRIPNSSASNPSTLTLGIF